MSKDQSTKAIWVVALLVTTVGVGAAVYALTVDSSSHQLSSSDQPMSASKSRQASSENVDLRIRFSDEGFTAKQYTVNAGGVVQVVNDSGTDMQFSSDDHPAHTEEAALNMRTLRSGESDVFTAPNSAGEYDFHDHLRSDFKGVLQVQ